VPRLQRRVSSTSSSGAALSFTTTSTTTTGGSWLTATPASGTTPGSISVTVNPTGLAAGTYTGTVSVASAGAANSPRTVAVTFTVTAAALPNLTLSPTTLSFYGASWRVCSGCAECVDEQQRRGLELHDDQYYNQRRGVAHCLSGQRYDAGCDQRDGEPDRSHSRNLHRHSLRRKCRRGQQSTRTVAVTFHGYSGGCT
jgi:hypothetical protein